MKAVLIRAGSGRVQYSPIHDSVTGILFPGKNDLTRSSLNLEIKDKKKECYQSIRRTRSENDVIRWVNKVSGRFSECGSARISEEGGGELVLKKKSLNLSSSCDGILRESEVVVEEEEEVMEYSSGGGIGKGGYISGGSGGDDSGGGNAELSDYYEKLLKANPGNPLILRNYGNFLHEVKRDYVSAEACYARAILASPGDGELLSLYGKLIWESTGDGDRAESYFDQAVQASPQDCYVMGSYANFLWNAEEDDEKEEISEVKVTASSAALVEAC